MTSVLNLLPLMLASPESTGATGAAGGSGSILWMLGSFALIIVVFYFLVIRPQNKKQKDAQKLLKSLKKGDRIVTIGGMRGTIVTVKDDVVLLKVDDNTKLEFNKAAISSVIERKEELVETKE
jgi:preprotein translocase subunit YajC